MAVMALACQPTTEKTESIRPSIQFPGYWEYKGVPVLLLGGTRNDNLFQEVIAPDHLRELAVAGGNYIRNTMSARDSGDVQPFIRLENGLYDLDQWNDEYWQRLDNLLETARELEIIVQLEVWDRFDFSRAEWHFNAFNPGININYTYQSTGLDSLYPEHPGQDLQPFFHSIPGMPKYVHQLDVVRSYQEKYVEKLLSHTFPYPNVLYTMNNETNTPVEWGQHWMTFIRNNAKQQSVEVYATDMFDANYRPRTCPPCMLSIYDSEMYQFLDVSQINSRNFGQAHWDTLQVIMDLVRDHKRPVNCTKVYGSGFSGFGSGSPQDGVERFCRILVGGTASARFHRPTYGNGLNDLAKATFAAVREVEKQIHFWEVDFAMDLLSNREENEAYLASNRKDKFLVYFPAGGSVDISVGEGSHTFDIHWIGVTPGEKRHTITTEAQGRITLETPDDSGWFAVVNLKE